MTLHQLRRVITHRRIIPAVPRPDHMMPSPDRCPARGVAPTAPPLIPSDKGKTFLTPTALMATPITGSDRRRNRRVRTERVEHKFKVSGVAWRPGASDGLPIEGHAWADRPSDVPLRSA